MAAPAVKFAVVDVADYLSKRQAAEPDLAADWSKLEELYNKKLWHQLTLHLQQFILNPVLQVGDRLIQLYHNFVSMIENKINPLALVEIVAVVVEQFTDKKEAVAFLVKLESKIKANDEALALCKVLQGQIHLEALHDMEAAARVVAELEGSLADADGVTPVHARFYRLAAEYYRVRGPMSRYYRAALRYVGCARGGAALPAPERRALARRLALCAVLAPDVYSLAELLAHPILSSLEGTSDAWLAGVLRAAARGDLAAYEAAAAAAPAAERAQLARADTQLRQKIAILCLMEMALQRGASSRRLSFADIAAAARVPLADVELLVMKALAENLIKGDIDQVAGTVSVAWARGRAADRAAVLALAARVDAWRGAAAAAHAAAAAAAHDLLLQH